MKMVLDASALAKRYVEEPGSEQISATLSQATALGLSTICLPEVVSALNRRCREGALSPDDYQRAKALLLADWQDATKLQLTQPVLTNAVALLEQCQGLRAMDALHLACALQWQAELFVSADLRQVQAAKAAGLTVLLVGKLGDVAPA